MGSFKHQKLHVRWRNCLQLISSLVQVESTACESGASSSGGTSSRAAGSPPEAHVWDVKISYKANCQCNVLRSVAACLAFLTCNLTLSFRLKLKQVLKFKRMNARNELMKLCSPLQRLHKIHPKSSGSHGFHHHCQRFHQFHCGGLNALEALKSILTYLNQIQIVTISNIFLHALWQGFATPLHAGRKVTQLQLSWRLHLRRQVSLSVKISYPAVNYLIRASFLVCLPLSWKVVYFEPRLHCSALLQVLVGPLGASESRFDLELPTLAMTRE